MSTEATVAAALLIVKIVAEGIGVCKEISDLAKRVQNGEIITEEEVRIAQSEAKKTISQWKEGL